MTSRAILNGWPLGVGQPIVTPTPTPAPVFTVQPSISPTSGTVGATFTGSDGTIGNGTVSARRWLLGGTAMSTATTYAPNAAGSLVYEVTATGAGGTTVATSAPVTVSAAAPVLNALTVSNSTATAGSPFTSAISGLTSGSSVSLSGGGAPGLSVSGSTISGTPTNAGAVNLVETLAGASNSPRTTTGAVTVSAAAPVLNALTVSNGTATAGSAFTSTISGLTSGSTVSLTGAGAPGLSVSGTTISGTPSTAGAVNVVETLSGASNSPRTTNGLVTVNAAAAALKMIFEGDSIPYYTANPLSMVNAFIGNYAASSGVAMTNLSVAGSKTLGAAPSLANRQSSVQSAASGFSPVLPILIGANDLYLASSVASWENDLLTQIASYRSQNPGIKIGFGFITPATDDSADAANVYRPETNVRRPAANAWMRSRVGQEIDFIIPYGDIPGFGADASPRSTSGWYVDGLHPARSGAAIMHACLEAVMLPILGGATATSPTAPVFPPFAGAAANTDYTLVNIVTGLAMGASATVSMTGGSFAVNRGAFDSSPKSVMNGDFVTHKLTAGAVGTPVTQNFSYGANTGSWTITATATPITATYDEAYSTTNVTYEAGGIARGSATGTADQRNARSATSRSSTVDGDYYAEFGFGPAATRAAGESGFAFGMIGAVNNQLRPGSNTSNGYNGFTLRSDNAATPAKTQLVQAGTQTNDVYKSFGPGDIMSVFVRIRSGGSKFYIARNGVLPAGDNPLTGAGGYALTATNSPNWWLNAHLIRNEAVIMNAGQRPFRYTPPSGFVPFGTP